MNNLLAMSATTAITASRYQHISMYGDGPPKSPKVHNPSSQTCFDKYLHASLCTPPSLSARHPHPTFSPFMKLILPFSGPSPLSPKLAASATTNAACLSTSSSILSPLGPVCPADDVLSSCTTLSYLVILLPSMRILLPSQIHPSTPLTTSMCGISPTRHAGAPL